MFFIGMADANIFIDGEIERLESCIFYIQNFLKTQKWWNHLEKTDSS